MMVALLAYAIPAFILFAIALGLAFACVLQYRLTSAARPEQRLVAVMVVVGLGALLSVALTARELDDSKATGVVTYGDLSGGFAASRWFSLFLVIASFVEVARGWVEARRRAQPDPAWPLLMTMLAYYLGTMLIQAVASDEPDFSVRTLYLPMLLTAIYYQRSASVLPVLGAARLVIAVLMLSSLGCIWLKPDFVMHRPEAGMIPGVDWRLYGLTPHANTLGPIALLGILIELHSPSRWWPLRWLARLGCLAVLVLAQSKTTWAAMPLLLLLVWLPLRLVRLADGAHPATRFRRSVLSLVGVIVLLVSMVAAAAAFDVAGYLEHRVDVVTLTGRTQIWDITLQAWRENILFGYGPGIWGPERQREFHMFYVGHAHNQVIQTLGEAGLAGLVLLLIYLGAMLVASLRSFVASRGLVFMLLLLLLVHCLTEAPMRSEGILSWSAFLHVLLMAMACHYARMPRPGRFGRTAPALACAPRPSDASHACCAMSVA